MAITFYKKRMLTTYGISSQSRQMRFSQADLDAYMARRRVSNPNALVADPTPAGQEWKLQEQIREECGRRGWVVLTGSMANRTSRTLGEPDFVIAADRGRTFFIEAKTKVGKLSLEQQAMFAHLTKLGHIPAVVRSLDEFLKVIT
jgi:hypothetical protein